MCIECVECRLWSVHCSQCQCSQSNVPPTRNRQARCGGATQRLSRTGRSCQELLYLSFLVQVRIGIAYLNIYFRDRLYSRVGENCQLAGEYHPKVFTSHTSPGKCGPERHLTPNFTLASFLSNWDKVTASEFQIIEGGKGLFLAHNRCYKNQSLPSTSCHAKKIPKIWKVY